MSTIILVLIVGLFLLGGVILLAGVFVDEEPTPRQIKNDQQELAEMQDLEAIAEMAEKYEQHEKWGPAINAWDRFLEVQPDSDQGRFRRGVARHEAGRNERAIEDLETVAENQDAPPAQVHLYLARAHRELDNETSAMPEYEEYLARHPGDLSVSREAAGYARELEKPTRAREIYERLRDQDDLDLFVEATLSIVEMDLDDREPDRAESHLDELEEISEDGDLTERQRLELLYQRGRWLEENDQPDEAHNLYREIYRQNPDYRDVKEIVEEQIHNMSEDELIRKMLSMGRDEFSRYCEELVELMGYEVMSSDSFNPDEVEISAREKANMMKVNKVLFAFKKWDNQAGEIPLKEFDLKMLEERFDRGFFVCPGGFNHQAEEYEKESPDLELVGPQRLLNYLREAEKQAL